ncbi:hypothetical protein [Arabiibacter massiliensis]|uniref:hypothetical protein n=1 Tax=Arabiibacter massiliensis TaxID=1870985 RepID=UPI001E2D2761|nr:hypothetical protein [Arabiibacter massiliensis]
MAPLAVVASLVLFAVLAIAVDQGLASAAKARQENALDDARAACMEASFAFKAKNADDPGRLVAERAIRAIRGAGCGGRIEAWFYEAPEGAVPADERLWVIGLQVTEDLPTVFARGFGVEAIAVASHRVVAAVPYAEERVWRPNERICGRFELPAGAGAGAAAFTPLASLDEFPAEMGEQARAALSAGSEAEEGRLL